MAEQHTKSTSATRMKKMRQRLKDESPETYQKQETQRISELKKIKRQNMNAVELEELRKREREKKRLQRAKSKMEVENIIENSESNQLEEAVDSTLYPVAMEEPEQDEEVYIPFGNLAVELIENAVTGEASENTQHSENALAEDSIVLVREEEEEEEDYSKTDEGLTQKYIEDFIYSNASENAAGSPSSDMEGRQLSKFPKIAKAVECGNSEVISALYHLLFLRNAWDTQEILIQRILNFTGFNCEENSDDHFTREMIIHSFSDELLLSIAAMLGIEHIRVKPIYFEKEKARLISLIMKFLNKPQPKRRQSRGPRQTNATPSNKKSDETKTPVRRKGRKKKVTTPVKTASQTKVDEKSLKNQIYTNLAGLLPEPIVSIKDEISMDKLCEKDAKNAVQDGKADGKKDSSVSTKKRLKDFPTVTKCVRKTPEELLMDIHVLLFSEAGENHRLKRSILEFEGFNFESDSEEYDERRDFLDRMSDKTVNDVAKTFSLEAKSTKDETISHVLSFLKKPDESLIKVQKKNEGDESSGLSDIDELDIAEMFESDDSVTCEVVPKRVECIDLISSGDESDKERKRAARQQTVGAKTVTKAAAPVTSFSSATSFPAAIYSSTESAPSGGRRTLSNFETICKIVNTHPDEYLVDIYDLLYLKQHEPRTLRKEILEFPGFDFMKGSPEYVKRKLLLDRMLYNSVRRIYNTLIHTSTEVKMFSKPAMITEIFDFLLKLPDNDTSIINIQQRNSKPVTTLPINRVTPLLTDSQSVGTHKPGIVIPPVSAPSQPGKLSDLKRVFQRVACFPCEYLIDVHKLLFMTDCDTKVIRQNIFGFKGFNFGVDSNEFQQRKMYLEYLTFHSLRKISSVLTTKTVDLRNSTKHELASHLTDVLAEYTNTYFDGTGTSALQNNVPQIVVTTSQQAVTTTQQVTANAQLNIPMSTDPGIEQIVVTPIIEPIISSPTTSPEPPTSVVGNISDIKTDSQMPTVATTTNRRKRKVQPVRIEPEPSQPEDAAQFSDINLPEVESYQQMYGQSLNIYSPNVVGQPGMTRGFGSPGLMPQSLAHLVPQTMSIPIIHTLSSQSHVPNQIYTVHQAMPPQPVSTMYPGDIMMPLECILTEDQDPVVESTSKKARLSPPPSKKSGDASKIPEGSKSSLHDKIRDAMNDTDEEECDKPLSSFLGHPNDRVLKQQICDIVEQTDLQDITINTVIQKIFNMYPKFDLSYRKEYIKSTLRSVLYKLGDQKTRQDCQTSDIRAEDSPDCSVSTTFSCENPERSQPSPISRVLES